ncbi:hypothetical protein BJF87_13665 [Gordonia sp. CNJ-863]|nr:hypothetical protein BJF87_13665 [Gordonia sp. CNJ-863]
MDMLELARKHLANACYGKFHVDDSIWFSGFRLFIEFLESRLGESSESLAGLGELEQPVIDWLESNAEPIVSHWVALKEMGRFVDYADRRAIAGTLPNFFTRLTAQGMNGPAMWAGRPTMRSAWDFALAPALIDCIRPRAIIELGTASGGSTAYWADLQRVHGINPFVLSMDISPPEFSYPGVTLIQGDSNHLAKALTDELLSALPHPWLIIEDAHVNIDGVLNHFDQFMHPGDYIMIEDVDAEPILGPFLVSRPNRYKVDTHFTDFFGHNATCAPDQILRREQVVAQNHSSPRGT